LFILVVERSQMNMHLPPSAAFIERTDTVPYPLEPEKDRREFTSQWFTIVAISFSFLLIGFSLGALNTLFSRTVQTDQPSHTNPGTRLKLRTFRVTTLAPISSAIEAIPVYGSSLEDRTPRRERLANRSDLSGAAVASIQRIRPA
jgi:hypothetical protein